MPFLPSSARRWVNWWKSCGPLLPETSEEIVFQRCRNARIDFGGPSNRLYFALQSAHYFSTGLTIGQFGRLSTFEITSILRSARLCNDTTPCLARKWCSRDRPETWWIDPDEASTPSCTHHRFWLQFRFRIWSSTFDLTVEVVAGDLERIQRHVGFVVHHYDPMCTSANDSLVELPPILLTTGFLVFHEFRCWDLLPRPYC